MDFNRKLIELVRSHKLIYDSRDPNYGDNAWKNVAWKDISSRLQVTEKECKKSWILLREGYRRTLKKKKASETDPVYRKDKDMRKWTYEDDLSFLSAHMKQRSYVETSPRNNGTNVEDNHPKMTNEASTPATNPDVAAQKRSFLKRSRTHEAVARRSCPHEATSNNLIKYVLEKTTKRSDIQHFFDSIATTVQSFSPHDRAIAKRKVFEFISQMEMEILDRRPAPSYQSKGSPVADDMEVTGSRSGLYATPPPEAATAGFKSNNSDEEAEELVLNIKVEPEKFLDLTTNIKREPYT